MSVLPDWMIEERRLLPKGHPERIVIEPYANTTKKPGQISWGLSSYGYDLRLGRKFLIFTDIAATEIDPLTMASIIEERVAAGRFVRHDGGSCLIPPNSFVLAESLEYVEMPRDCIAHILGKCLTGDTLVFNPVTGLYSPIRERSKIGSVVSWTPTRPDYAVAAPVESRGIAKVFRLQTKSGLTLRGTAEHPIMTQNGWRKLASLELGTKVQRPGQLPWRGEGYAGVPLAEARLLALLIADGQCDTPGSSPAYTKADPAMADLLRRSAAELLGCDVTGPNKNRRYLVVNNTGRGGVVTTNRCAAWLRRRGLNVGSPHRFIPSDVLTSSRDVVAEFIRVLFSGDGSIFLQHGHGHTYVHIEYSSASAQLVEVLRHLLLRFGVDASCRVKETTHRPAHILVIRKQEDVARYCHLIGFVAGSFKDQFLHQTARPYLAEVIDSPPFLLDKVVSVEPDGEEEVFDIEVPGSASFVAGGFFVHNSTYARCGVGLTTTPIEPSWRGIITLEIPNHTRLPARVHADMGIGQLVFFKGEAMCRTSYAEKEGACYQDQKGLTLPRA